VLGARLQWMLECLVMCYRGALPRRLAAMGGEKVREELGAPRLAAAQ
jgi:hypothetical protein